MSVLERAIDLEQRKFAHLLNELNESENERALQIRAKFAAQGSISSGGIVIAITDIRKDKLRRLVAGAIAIRRSLIERFPELGTDAAIDQLSTKIAGLIPTALTSVFASVMPTSTPLAVHAAESRYQREALVLQQEAKNQFEILKQEVALNIHKKPEPAATVSINTGGGPSIVNTGIVYGNILQAIEGVGRSGQSELADAFRQLAAVIENATELAEERGGYLEQLQFVAKQAMEPPQARQVSVVNAVLIGLRNRLQDLANVAQVLSVAGPAIAEHFGLHWPH